MDEENAMTTWFVTRHPAAVEWLAGQGVAVDRVAANLDPAVIVPGDRVIGTLPAHVAGEVCGRGGRYFHLAMDVPGSARGAELTVEEMVRSGARLEEYRVEKIG